MFRNFVIASVIALTTLPPSVAQMLPTSDPNLPAQDLAADENPDAVEATPVTPITIEQKFAELSLELPSFGGMFIDADDALTLYLADDVDRQHAGPAIARVFGEKILAGRTLNVQPADFRYDDLSHHFPRAVQLMSNDGIVLTDIDERANRIHIGVLDEQALEWAEEQLHSAGVPRAMVTLEVIQPVHEETLQNIERPVLGGYEIGSAGGTCTLGFNARRNGLNGFVTNAHCTPAFGVDQDTNFRQDAQHFNTIADERIDPALFSGWWNGCPSGRVCRRSDAAWIDYRNGGNQRLGIIRRPNALGGILGDSFNREFRITAERWLPIFAGTQVNKVGRTTGWTRGNVTRTCVNVRSNGTNRVMLCQNQAAYTSAGGDSGSAVFVRTGGNNVELYGIHWGSGGTFSAIGEVFGELGSMRTCVSGC